MSSRDLHVERAEFPAIVHVQHRGSKHDQRPRALATTRYQRLHLLIVKTQGARNPERRMGVAAGRFQDDEHPVVCSMPFEQAAQPLIPLHRDGSRIGHHVERRGQRSLVLRPSRRIGGRLRLFQHHCHRASPAPDIGARSASSSGGRADAMTPTRRPSPRNSEPATQSSLARPPKRAVGACAAAHPAGVCQSSSSFWKPQVAGSSRPMMRSVAPGEDRSRTCVGIGICDLVE